MATFREIIEEVDELEEQSMVQDPNSPKFKAAELVARSFAARDAMHKIHFMTNSYAVHKATQGFYEGIIPLVDTFGENLMGRFGQFEGFPNIKESALDPLQVVGNLTKFIDSSRMLIGELPEIQNLVDEILALCNSTAFLVRELK